MGRKLADTTQLLRSYKRRNYRDEIAQLKKANPSASFAAMDKCFPIYRKNTGFTFVSTFMLKGTLKWRAFLPLQVPWIHIKRFSLFS